MNSVYWTVSVTVIKRSIDCGATRLITAEQLTIKRQLELIEKYKVNILHSTPGILVPCLKYERIHEMDLSSVQYIFIYGGKLPMNFILDIKRYFPNVRIYEIYGATEIGQVSLASFDHDGCGNGHRLHPNYIVKIVDDDENRCGPNTVGEIRIKSAYKFLGYLDDPVQTSNALDSEDFYRTGDIGQFNDQGRLFITDRKKNIINVFYYDSMILPHEIEECVAKMSDVLEVCVVGVPIVSEFFLPAVVLVRKPGSKLSKRDVFNVIAGKRFF